MRSAAAFLGAILLMAAGAYAEGPGASAPGGPSTTISIDALGFEGFGTPSAFKVMNPTGGALLRWGLGVDCIVDDLPSRPSAGTFDAAPGGPIGFSGAMWNLPARFSRGAFPVTSADGHPPCETRDPATISGSCPTGWRPVPGCGDFPSGDGDPGPGPCPVPTVPAPGALMMAALGASLVGHLRRRSLQAT